MNKTVLVTALLAMSASLSAAEQFPEWRSYPQDGLEEGLIAGVSCVESMGDMTLDMDIAAMEARASLASSLETMVHKEVGTDRNSEKKTIITADRKDKVVTTTISANSTSKQITNQLMKYTWIKESVSVEKGVDEYLCTRIVARVPKFVEE
ncbi:hypothetical protein [Vibrio tapetis]|nr:hypothetical protein [Vibrio tapetis]